MSRRLKAPLRELTVEERRELEKLSRASSAPACAGYLAYPGKNYPSGSPLAIMMMEIVISQNFVLYGFLLPVLAKLTSI